MPRYYYSIETIFLCIIFIRFLLRCKIPEYVSLFCFVWFASLALFVTSHSYSLNFVSFIFHTSTNSIYEDINTKKKHKWWSFDLLNSISCNGTRVFKFFWEKALNLSSSWTSKVKRPTLFKTHKDQHLFPFFFFFFGW